MSGLGIPTMAGGSGEVFASTNISTMVGLLLSHVETQRFDIQLVISEPGDTKPSHIAGFM
jgi:hypothetical protein